MKKNIYYTTLYGKPAEINMKFGTYLSIILGYPKSILDVFLRHNMGERYFTLFRATLLGLAMFAIPLISSSVYHQQIQGETTYYIFLIAYVIMSAKRYMEVRREPSVFDFKKFSLSRGEPHRFFLYLRIGGKGFSMRNIEVYIEPLFCFLIGVLLLLFGQVVVALIIIFCSISYFFVNQVSAIQGDHFVMDKIDEMICNEDMNETFLQDREVSSRQVPFYSKKPSTEELRKDLIDFLKSHGDDDDDDDAVPLN